MDYVKVAFQFSPREPYAEIAVSELSDLGYESFVDTEEGVEAFIQERIFDEAALYFINDWEDVEVSFHSEKIPFTNWNAKWEEDFKPVIVRKDCIVRAPFHHLEEEYTYDIIIQPQMSFGTGHHATTSLMIQFLLDEDLQGKRVLDLGSGTGVLAILAEKRGARDILATDIEDYIVDNAKENIALNQCVEIALKKADVANDRYEDYDLILANINLNVLIQSMETISSAGRKGSKIMMSGFYDDDIPKLQETAAKCGLVLEEVRKQERWAAVLLIKE
jgi:ribosomal protein L11 methyltransferase